MVVEGTYLVSLLLKTIKIWLPKRESTVNALDDEIANINSYTRQFMIYGGGMGIGSSIGIGIGLALAPLTGGASIVVGALAGAAVGGVAVSQLVAQYLEDRDIERTQSIIDKDREKSIEINKQLVSVSRFCEITLCDHDHEFSSDQQQKIFWVSLAYARESYQSDKGDDSSEQPTPIELRNYSWRKYTFHEAIEIDDPELELFRKRLKIDDLPVNLLQMIKDGLVDVKDNKSKVARNLEVSVSRLKEEMKWAEQMSSRTVKETKWVERVPSPRTVKVMV